MYLDLRTTSSRARYILIDLIIDRKPVKKVYMIHIFNFRLVSLMYAFMHSQSTGYIPVCIFAAFVEHRRQTKRRDTEKFGVADHI